MSNILISIGQIPAKLDAVKYIGNKFSGGLMLKLALELIELGHSVTIVKWKYNKIDTEGILMVHDVDDIGDYSDFIIMNRFDTYILGAAVANLMPVTPWKGKFPSHNYSEGDVIDIKFKIAPRIINMVKRHHPKSTLIGFKLSTGSHHDAFETLKGSNADLVIYNNPSDLANITFCYKTFLTKTGNRDDIGPVIDELCKTRYTDTSVLYNMKPSDKEDYDLKTYIQVKELEKYVLDEDRHGSVAILLDKELYTHTRYNKYVGLVQRNQHIDNDLVLKDSKGVEKYTEAIPMFKEMNRAYRDHKYFIHTHKSLDVVVDHEVGYIAPNSTSNITYLGGDEKERCIVKSDCHGYFMSFKNLDDVLETLTNRNWRKYDPPVRYVNDFSDIFNDELFEINRFQSRMLEIGGNTDSFPKVSALVSNSKRMRLDPYFDDDSPKVTQSNGKKFDLIVAKNCVPIMGIDMLSNYAKIGRYMLFNFPKQYNCNREVECVSGALKTEVSYQIDDKVFHSLVTIKGESPEVDVFHHYDAISEKNLYERFHTEFELLFRYTKSGVWCLMKRKV